MFPDAIVILESGRSREVNMSPQTITEDFRKLSADEKLRLLQDLWDQIAEEYARPVGEPHRRLLDERLRQHEEDPSGVETWQKARDDVLSKL
jgi:putative addiction module component (TIGR02574 family)